MKLAFMITFKRSTRIVAEVEGYAKNLDALTVEDITSKVPETEQFLEKLTGLRVHIESVWRDDD